MRLLAFSAVGQVDVPLAWHGAAVRRRLCTTKHRAHHPEKRALLQIVDTSLPSIAATRPDTALALWGRARPAGHPAARLAA